MPQRRFGLNRSAIDPRPRTKSAGAKPSCSSITRPLNAFGFHEASALIFGQKEIAIRAGRDGRSPLITVHSGVRTHMLLLKRKDADFEGESLVHKGWSGRWDSNPRQPAWKDEKGIRRPRSHVTALGRPYATNRSVVYSPQTCTNTPERQRSAASVTKLSPSEAPAMLAHPGSGKAGDASHGKHRRKRARRR